MKTYLKDVRHAVKRCVLRVTPSLYYFINSYRHQRYCKKKFRKFQDEFKEKVYGQVPISVLAGPFNGLKYYNKNVWGLITNKWIGSYEEELHDVLSKIIRLNYPRIIDVGAAEGYYAVGLANKCPASTVLSFDIDPIARIRQRQLRKLNGVTNLNIQAYCYPKTLSESIIPNSTLLICDVEGYEYILLDIGNVPKLKSTDILVEIHGYENLAANKVREIIKSRFADSHRIQVFQATPRDPQQYLQKVSNLKDISPSLMREAMDEHRFASQEWLWMEAESGLDLVCENAERSFL